MSTSELVDRTNCFAIVLQSKNNLLICIHLLHFFSFNWLFEFFMYHDYTFKYSWYYRNQRYFHSWVPLINAASSYPILTHYHITFYSSPIYIRTCKPFPISLFADFLFSLCSNSRHHSSREKERVRERYDAPHRLPWENTHADAWEWLYTRDPWCIYYICVYVCMYCRIVVSPVCRYSEEVCSGFEGLIGIYICMLV